MNEEIAREIAAVHAILAAMEEAMAIADQWWDEGGSHCDCIDAMQQILKSAIEKAKGDKE